MTVLPLALMQQLGWTVDSPTCLDTNIYLQNHRKKNV